MILAVSIIVYKFDLLWYTKLFCKETNIIKITSIDFYIVQIYVTLTFLTHL